MSAFFELTEEQKTFFLQEGHYGLDHNCAIALIFKDGNVELDYHDEILRKYAAETNVEMVEKRFKESLIDKEKARDALRTAEACYGEAEDYSFKLGKQLKALKEVEVKKK